MTYTDLTAQSPETQAAVEQEVRVLLKVGQVSWGFSTLIVGNINSVWTGISVFYFYLLPLVLFEGFLCFFFCVQDSYERAKSLLKSHAKEHKKLAEALLLYETLDAKEIQLVLEGKTLETRWAQRAATQRWRGEGPALTCSGVMERGMKSVVVMSLSCFTPQFILFVLHMRCNSFGF